VHQRVGDLAEEEGERPEEEDPGVPGGKAGGTPRPHQDKDLFGEEEKRDGDGDSEDGHQEDRVHRDAARTGPVVGADHPGERCFTTGAEARR